MKKINTYTEFELCVKLLDCVNSKEEFDYFIKMMKQISPLSFFYNYSTQGAFKLYPRKLSKKYWDESRMDGGTEQQGCYPAFSFIELKGGTEIEWKPTKLTKNSREF